MHCYAHLKIFGLKDTQFNYDDSTSCVKNFIKVPFIQSVYYFTFYLGASCSLCHDNSFGHLSNFNFSCLNFKTAYTVNQGFKRQPTNVSVIDFVAFIFSCKKWHT